MNGAHLAIGSVALLAVGVALTSAVGSRALHDSEINPRSLDSLAFRRWATARYARQHATSGSEREERLWALERAAWLTFKADPAYAAWASVYR